MRFHPAEFGDATSMRGKLTAYERRHGEEYTGLDLPLGCRVRYRRPEPALKEKHKFDTPTRDGVFVGWDLQPGGVWQGNYIVADAEELLKGIRKIHVVKELRDPEEIEFQFQGNAELKRAWPVEATEPGADAVFGGPLWEKRRRSSSRPDYIDSKSSNKLQYPTPLKIAEDERLRKEREVGEGASSTGGTSGEGAEAAHEYLSGQTDVQADPIATAFRAAVERPTIMTYPRPRWPERLYTSRVLILWLCCLPAYRAPRATHTGTSTCVRQVGRRGCGSISDNSGRCWRHGGP